MIKSQRLLVGELDHKMLFCWFVGLRMDEAVWEATTSPRTGSVGYVGAVS